MRCARPACPRRRRPPVRVLMSFGSVYVMVTPRLRPQTPDMGLATNFSASAWRAPQHVARVAQRARGQRERACQAFAKCVAAPAAGGATPRARPPIRPASARSPWAARAHGVAHVADEVQLPPLGSRGDSRALAGGLITSSSPCSTSVGARTRPSDERPAEARHASACAALVHAVHDGGRRTARRRQPGRGARPGSAGKTARPRATPVGDGRCRPEPRDGAGHTDRHRDPRWSARPPRHPRARGCGPCRHPDREPRARRQRHRQPDDVCTLDAALVQHARRVRREHRHRHRSSHGPGGSATMVVGDDAHVWQYSSATGSNTADEIVQP